MKTLAMLLAATSVASLALYCVLIRRRLLPRQRIPRHYQLVAWLGILTFASTICFAIAALTEP